MPWKQWAYLEKVSSADFQTYLQNQVVPAFTSAAQRDTQWPTPPKGALCILTDTNNMQKFDGTSWVTASNGTRIAYVNGPARDATQGLVQHAQVSFTLTATRMVLVTAWVDYQEITAAANSSVYWNLGTDGGRQMRFAATLNLPLNGIGSGLCALWIQLAAGAHTAEVHIANNSTVGAARVLAGPAGSWIAVQDYGN